MLAARRLPLPPDLKPPAHVLVLMLMQDWEGWEEREA